MSQSSTISAQDLPALALQMALSQPRGTVHFSKTYAVREAWQLDALANHPDVRIVRTAAAFEEALEDAACPILLVLDVNAMPTTLMERMLQRHGLTPTILIPAMVE